MHTFDQETDASFYNLIYQLAGESEGAGKRERRTRRRYAYPALQRIAPCRGPEMPKADQFVTVQCYDLTRKGLAFLHPTSPDFQRLVVAFDAQPETIYVEARITHTRLVWRRPDGEIAERKPQDTAAAVPMVLVGCRFRGRLPRPAE